MAGIVTRSRILLAGFLGIPAMLRRSVSDKYENPLLYAVGYCRPRIQLVVELGVFLLPSRSHIHHEAAVSMQQYQVGIMRA
jgi:hypothetical protein